MWAILRPVSTSHLASCKFGLLQIRLGADHNRIARRERVMAKPATLKYRAFISYSHVDSNWAKWLHRALEGFVIDKDIVGRETPIGTIPEALRPVFRDRDDFTAGHTLSEQTLAALNASAALIVICSPAACKSQYVNEEITLFKSRHPDRPVIPLIVGGTPWTGENECFPPALKFRFDARGRITKKRIDIIAADLRDSCDGKELAVAKVIASLLGLSADDVYRRADRERRSALRRRRRVQSLVATLALLLALGGGIWFSQDLLREQYHWRLVMSPRVVMPDAERALKPGMEFSECTSGCPTMVVIPAGKFLMGWKNGSNRERPPHEVSFSRPFAIGKYEVTFAEWDACVDAGGCPILEDEGWGRGTMPALNVNWNDAKRYVAWLAKLTGKPYRLPSEAEWEYAARGGTTTLFPFGDNEAHLHEHAWYEENSGITAVHELDGVQLRNTTGRKSHPVGKKRPNGFGLHDVLGNVMEWVEDYWHGSYLGAPTDGSVWVDKSLAASGDPATIYGLGSDVRYRVLRGGDWSQGYGYLRVSTRIQGTTGNRLDQVGFRVARTLGPE